MRKPSIFYAAFLVQMVCLHAAEVDTVYLAKKLANGVRSFSNKRVAVLSFPYHDEKISSGSSIVSERLTTDLVGRKGIQIVERRLIKKLMEEKKLSETGALDPETAKKIGSILGVDVIVTGTLIDLDKNLTEVNARMIHVGTGEIVSAAKAVLVRSWTDNPRSVSIPKPALNSKSLMAPNAQALNEMEEEGEDRGRREAEHDVAATSEKKGKSLHLSNESFPEGRRQYNPVVFPPSTGQGQVGSQPEFYQSDPYEYDEPYANTASPAPSSTYSPASHTTKQGYFPKTFSHPKHPRRNSNYKKSY